MPAKNDDAVGLMNRGVWFAGKPRSNGKLSCLLEPSLLAKNDDAMRLVCRVPLWERCLPAKNDDAVGLMNRGVWFAGKPRSNGKLS
ncbi:hypothetical protein, partial [Pseudomonas syringae]